MHTLHRKVGKVAMWSIPRTSLNEKLKPGPALQCPNHWIHQPLLPNLKVRLLCLNLDLQLFANLVARCLPPILHWVMQPRLTIIMQQTHVSGYIWHLSTMQRRGVGETARMSKDHRKPTPSSAKGGQRPSWLERSEISSSWQPGQA